MLDLCQKNEVLLKVNTLALSFLTSIVGYFDIQSYNSNIFPNSSINFISFIKRSRQLGFESLLVPNLD